MEERDVAMVRTCVTVDSKKYTRVAYRDDQVSMRENFKMMSDKNSSSMSEGTSREAVDQQL